MRSLCCGVLLATVAASGAAAGAWPRGDGNVFLSLEASITAPRDAFDYASCPRFPTFEDLLDRPVCELAPSGTGQPGTLDVLRETASSYGSVFFEYGVGERLTFGVDLGYAWEDESWSALVFARRSFMGDWPGVWAVEMAAGGGTSFDGSGMTILRPAIHWGRGTEWGWFSVESYAVHRSDLDRMAYKLDLTAGWNRSEQVSWVAQVLTADYPGSDPTVRLAPSHVWRANERLRLRTGILADVAGGDALGAVTAVWFEF